MDTMLQTLVTSALFVSFPEELLTVITTLIVSGNKDLLSFKNRNNILRIFLCAILMVISSLTVNVFFTFSFRFILNTLLFYVIMTLVFKQKPFSLFFGFFLSSLVVMASEFLFYPILIKLSGFTYNDVYNHVLYKFIFSLPDRIFQIASIVIVLKVKKVNVRENKLFLPDLIIMIVYLIIITGNILLIDEKGTYVRDFSASSILLIAVNAVLLISFSFWLISYIFNLRQKISMKENIHDIELHHLKQLIIDGNADYAAELIDITLRERGYYDDEHQ
ncbi:MAG: hypothetical protein N3I35_03055 [Clostridia bacterium]|nr:hypothetical protein [Clostridia bacterium]